MKKSVLFVIFLFCIHLIQAQYPQFMLNEGNIFEYKRNLISDQELKKYHKLFSDKMGRNYDVISYDLKLDWTEALSSEPIKYEFTGKNNITLQITEQIATQIELDALNLQINKVFVNNSEISDYYYDNKILNINLGKSYQIGDTLLVIVDYKFIGKDTIGFYLYPKNMPVGYGPSGEMVYTAERIAYTMSEPEDARAWMPCNDRPNDKARASIKIRVPKGYTAVSNGLLLDKTEDNETTTFHWADTSLISTYLMAVAASKFVSYNEWYKNPNNPNDSIELVYYVWENDLENEITDWTVYNAKNAFKPTPYLMELYSTRFIPYPFRKYGQVAIQPFSFGGMEHQTITFVNRSWLRGRSQSGIAHELSHHWLGNLVTCEDWQNIWFNEGGATWSEAIWAEGWGGYNWYLDYMNSVGNQYRNRKFLIKIPIYDIPTDYIFSFPMSLLVYNKSSWIYHQLRIMLGDDIFFRTLRKLMQKYAFSNINVEKFQKHFEEEIPNPPLPFDIFFDQWLKKPGHPIYELSASATLSENTNSYKITVNLKQTQEKQEAHPLFITYLPIVFFNKDTTTEIFVVNDKKEQSFEFNLPFLPDSVYIETRKVLAESNKAKVNVITSIKDEEEIIVYPTILSQNSFITIELNNLINHSIIELYNIVGEKLGEIHTNSKITNYHLKDLPKGIYFVKINYNNKSYTKRIIIQ